MTNKNYLAIDVAKGYPAGDKIRYECLLCGDSIPSKPAHAVACSCRNIIVDVDAGRVAVKDNNRFKAYVV